jgi:hypothetical protein
MPGDCMTGRLMPGHLMPGHLPVQVLHVPCGPGPSSHSVGQPGADEGRGPAGSAVPGGQATHTPGRGTGGMLSRQ